VIGEEQERSIEILMVEDGPAGARLAAEAFKEAKLLNNLKVVGDGEEALGYLRKEGKHANAVRPDIIFLDLKLPKKDGRQTLAEIKADENLRRIPVVVLTNSDAEQDILRMYDLHANCYIVKPLSLEKFIAVMQSIKSFWFKVVSLPTH
jgi:chemotaxis family two-component system response regulator Rcp1